MLLISRPTIALALTLLLSSGCAGLTPAQRGAVGPMLLQGLGDVLVCGAPLAFGAVSGEVSSGDYIGAAGCYLDRLSDRARPALESAPQPTALESAPQPTAELGQAVGEASRAAAKYLDNPEPQTEAAYLDAKARCDSLAPVVK